MLKRILFLFACTMIAGSFLCAQITTSSLNGSTRDSSNNPLAGATVKATHEPTGTVYTTVSGKQGQFNIQNMRVGGPYTIEISFVGFETQRFEDVYLRLAEPFLLNTLMAKSITTIENVVLTTIRKNAIFNSSRTGATTNISRSQIERMPTVRRSVNDLTRSAPQSYTSGDGAQIGGGNNRQNNFTIDGAEYNNSFGISSNGSGNLPGGGDPISLDALDEFSINITPFDVRQSGFIGAGVNAVTRSGTNNFTGSYYQYWRNEKQRGNLVGKTKFARTPEQYKLQGFRIGGPIIKNKLFFFFSYETDNTPRQLQTRFAATGAAPFGSSPNIARPTASDLQMFSAYLKSNYDYDTGPYDNYTLQVIHTKYFGRMDWNIDRNNHLMIRYGQVEGGNPSPPSTSTGGSNLVGVSGNRQDINSMYFANSIYYQGINYYSGSGELTSKISKRFSNVLRGTYTYQNESRSTPSSNFPLVDILLNGTTYTTFGYEPFSYGNLRKVKGTSFIDNLTWSKGKHIVTVGAQRDEDLTINGFMRFGTSYYVFNSWNDFISGAKPYNFAVTFSFLPGFAQAFPSFKFRQWAWYGQDEITLNDKFRLTVGLRADRPSYPSVPEIKTNPFIQAVTFRGGVTINTGVLPAKKILWSPRIGFNWDLYGDRSLQIRGGTGVFTGKIPFVWIVSQSGDNGMLQTTIGINGTANTPGPFNPDPRAYFPSSIPTPGSIIPTTIEALTPDYKFPQSWKSSLGLDAKLPGNTILTLEAIFNKDLNTSLFNNVNLVASTPMGVAGYPDTRPLYPSANNLKYINPVKTTPGQITSVVFVPNGSTATSPSSIGAASVVQMGNGSQGYYFSLAAQLQKQIGKSLNVSLAYTKSIAGNLFDGGGDQPLSAWQGTPVGAIDPNNAALSYANYVMPDRLTASISFRKEYFKHLGTTFTLFYNGSCDGRFSYIYGTDFNNDGVTGNDLIYIPKDPSEIDFSSFTYNGVTYSAQQQKDLFFKYIDQDKYLRAHKGQYAERNGGLYPWRNQFDVKFMQDIFINLGKKRNTFQFSIDITNFANLLNSNWGKVEQLNAVSGQILVPTNQSSIVPGGTTRPTFRLAADRNNPITSTFRDVVSTASTWFMQFGIRYIFGN